jgi:hypothetical protein
MAREHQVISEELLNVASIALLVGQADQVPQTVLVEVLALLAWLSSLSMPVSKRGGCVEKRPRPKGRGRFS